MTEPSGNRDPAARPNQIGKLAVRQGKDEREVIFTRVFDAPRELVFKAWTDPELLRQWWGPQGYDTPVAEIDLRPGGEWKTVMRGADGLDLPSKGIYLEVDPPSRLVMTDTADDMPQEWHDIVNRFRQGDESAPLHIVWTITFEESDGQATVTVISRFPSAEDLEAILNMGAAVGWSQSLDKLEAVVTAVSR